jgi:hypothetical protein
MERADHAARRGHADISSAASTRCARESAALRAEASLLSVVDLKRVLIGGR